jgi:hypothetical protein
VAVEERNGNEIVVAKDQALQTKHHATEILDAQTDSKCRLCEQFDKTIGHIIPACPVQPKEQYTKRYNHVCAQLHFNISTKIGVKL